MKQKIERIISILTLAAAVIHFAAACVAAAHLPEIVPTHFNLQWICDGIGSRWTLLIPAALPILSGGFAVGSVFSGKLKNPRIVSIIMLVLTLYLGGVFWMTYPLAASGVTLGEQIDPQALGWLLPLLYAVLFVIIGNYMPVIQPNKTLGIRVGWTLNNPQCWRLTHRFAGRLWVITGLVMAAVILIALGCGAEMGAWIYILFFEMLLVNIIAPCVYAWMHKDDAA